MRLGGAWKARGWGTGALGSDSGVPPAVLCDLGQVTVPLWILMFTMRGPASCFGRSWCVQQTGRMTNPPKAVRSFPARLPQPQKLTEFSNW